MTLYYSDQRELFLQNYAKNIDRRSSVFKFHKFTATTTKKNAGNKYRGIDHQQKLLLASGFLEQINNLAELRTKKNNNDRLSVKIN